MPGPARYAHDCTACVSLGALGDYDLYRCSQSGLPTVVARFGDDGPEYLSGSPLQLDVGPDVVVRLDATERRG